MDAEAWLPESGMVRGCAGLPAACAGISHGLLTEGSCGAERHGIICLEADRHGMKYMGA